MRHTVVRMETNFGVIDIELYDDRAPITVGNFLKYVSMGHYNGTIFHRVIDGFMIQGGGFLPNMVEKPTPFGPIVNEAAKSGIRNKRGTIAMARTSEPNSATSQFFINLVDNGFLDWDYPKGDGYGYCVFGTVINGMDVVDKIAKVQTRNVGIHENVPVQPVIINRVYVIGQK